MNSNAPSSLTRPLSTARRQRSRCDLRVDRAGVDPHARRAARQCAAALTDDGSREIAGGTGGQDDAVEIHPGDGNREHREFRGPILRRRHPHVELVVARRQILDREAAVSERLRAGKTEHARKRRPDHLLAEAHALAREGEALRRHHRPADHRRAARGQREIDRRDLLTDVHPDTLRLGRVESAWKVGRRKRQRLLLLTLHDPRLADAAANDVPARRQREQAVLPGIVCLRGAGGGHGCRRPWRYRDWNAQTATPAMGSPTSSVTRPEITPMRGRAKSALSIAWPSTNCNGRPRSSGRRCPNSSDRYPLRVTRIV